MLDDEDRGVQFTTDRLDQRARCLGLALGESGGRLVHAQQLRVEGEEPGELDDAACAG